MDDHSRKQASVSPFSSTSSLDKLDKPDKLAHPAVASFSTSPSPSHHPGLPQRSPSGSSIHKSSLHSHRSSFAENLRNHQKPSSPRSSRHPSFTQSAVQELMAYPPPSRQPNPFFAGRDWRDVRLAELVAPNPDEVRWVDLESSVEEATMLLIKGAAAGNCVMIKDGPLKQPVSFFDYNDLNAYLVAVVGLAKPDEQHVQLYDSLAKRAQDRVPIPMRDIQPICRHEQLVSLPPEEFLPRAIEVFGSGIHRLLVTTQDGETIGVVSQLKLLEFFWNEGINFPLIDRLYPTLLRDLQIGSQQIIAINADAPLAEALVIMFNEGLTSLAVIDNASNVVGNISTADTRLLTSAASMPLLKQSCMHFITVILSERGMEQGRDSVPVFYVTPYSTLAGTVAKLVATRSHRMWVVESASPSPSAPATPLLDPVSAPTNAFSSGTGAAATSSSSTSGVPPGGASPSFGATVITPTPGATHPGGGAFQSSAPPSPLPTSAPGFAPGFAPAQSVPAAALPGARLSGRLTGVVSLTDILNLFARTSGLNPKDPGEQRDRRRRSSSSSIRPSLDGERSVRGSLDVRR